eukprot:NODE_33_length_32023_cov_0.217579.p13 type:complete len:234 gc:universal NODE_33_length_32023_cov_0.217579:2415-1714(-)
MSSHESLSVKYEQNISRIIKSKTTPNLTITETDGYSFSPILNIYMGLPSPLSPTRKAYDPFDDKTPFHDYISKHGRKHSNANWQNYMIEKSLLKQTSSNEISLQLFTLILRYEKTGKEFEKPSICSCILDIAKDNVEYSDELCCLLLKQLMNNKSGALNISWALFALLFPYLAISDEIRHMVIYTINRSNQSQFDDIVAELKYRAINSISRRHQRPCGIEITKYEVFFVHIEM